MPAQRLSIPYGRSAIEIELPASTRATIAVSQPVPPLADVSGAIQAALRHPIDSPPLHQLAHAGNRVCIVFTDITRSSPDHLLIPALFGELERAGVHDSDVTLLCGTGMHRASTRAEKIAKLGEAVAERYHVLDNQAQDPRMLVDLGATAGGVPVSMHRSVVEADLVLATGIVEPHQYAGYSGGRKTVAVGAAGEALIAHTHGPDFIDHPGTRLGRIEGNPFHEAITEAARRAGLRFILNAVLDDQGRILRVAAGEPDAAFRDLVAFARSAYEVQIPHAFDIVIGGVGYPKDSNLYQATRAPSYLFFAPTSVVRPGGYLIIPARCEEGAGAGVGEERFLSAMRDSPSVASILEDARRNGYPPGQQRAFVMAKVLEQAHVMIVGSECPDLVRACKMIPVATIEQALAMAQADVGDPHKVLVVPHAMQTLPIVADTGGGAAA